MSKKISISNISKNNNSKSRQLNKELFESRLQLNLFKKTSYIPFSITVNKSLEKTENMSINSKDLSMKKFFKIPKRNIYINNNKKKLADLSNDNIQKFNPDKIKLSKFSNKKLDITNPIYQNNTKTANNSLINKRVTTSNFINNNYSTIRTYVDKNQIKKNEIKIQRKKNDINKKEKNCISKSKNIDSNNNYKRNGLLLLNLNISNFQNRLMKNYNNSGIINNTFNNNYNYNNKSRNIFLEKNLNIKSKDYFNKKLSQKFTLNKNKKNDLSLNDIKDKSFNNINQFSKNKFSSIKTLNKQLQFLSINKNNQNSKTIYLRNNNEIKNKKNKNSLQVNNVNINNYINCNINYINNLNNDKKIKKESNINSTIFSYNYNDNYKTNKLFFQKNSIDYYKFSKNKTNLDKIELNFEKSKNEQNNIMDINKSEDNISDSMFKNDIQEKSQNDFEDSKEDSGLLSFDKIEDLIVYNNMKDINKKDSYLFFKDDRKNFYFEYKKILSKNFFDSC